MLKKACTAISISSLLLGMPIMALGQGTYDSHYYAGIGLGVSDLDPEENTTGYDVDDSRDFGWKITLGYEVSERFNLEAMYADLGEATLTPQGTIGYQVFALNGLYRFYHHDGDAGFTSRQGLSYYAKLGVGKMNNDGENITYYRVHDVHVVYGLGAEYGLADGLSVRGEAEFYDRDAHFFSLNLMKRF